MPKKVTPQQFIEKAKSVHSDTYDYSLVEYKNNRTKVKIICKEHGVFEQIPGSHLNGNGCVKCGKERCKISNRKTAPGWSYDTWIKSAKNLKILIVSKFT